MSCNEVEESNVVSPVLPSLCLCFLFANLFCILLVTCRMGLSYNKRRNMIELAVMRSCTAKSSIFTDSQDNENQEGDTGWPGMMSVRVHELDGVYDHPVLPMSGERCQLLEIQCHSKLAAKRIQKPKKGSKPDGSDDNADAAPIQDMRSGYVILLSVSDDTFEHYYCSCSLIKSFFLVAV